MLIESYQSSRRPPVLLTGCLALLLVIAAAMAYAATPQWKPEKWIELIIASSAGSGPDYTGRVLQKLVQDGGLVAKPVSVVNKPGGGGNLAYSYLNQFAGDGHYMAVATATLLTNHILGLSPFNYTDFTPVSVLYGEYHGFAVNSESRLKTGKDLLERVKQNAESVTFAFGTSRGNSNHIAIALAVKAAGVDARRLKIVLYKSSIDATTALMGGHVDVVATPMGTYSSLLASGKLRIIAIAAEQRIGGKYASTPTWREQGFNVVSSDYKMVIAPKGWNADQIAFWDNVLARVSQSDAWKKELDANEWIDSYKSSADSRRYLDARYDEYRKILAELGLVK